MGDQDKESTSRGLTRRDALKLGGALAWAVPLVQTVDIRAAEAQVGSPPPEPIEPTYEGPGVGGDPGGGGGGTPTTTLDVLDVTASPNPLHVSRKDRLRIRFFVSGPATVETMIMRRGRVVRQLQVHDLSATGWTGARWDGKNHRGKDVRAGRYYVVAMATDAHGRRKEARLRVRVLS